MTVLARAVDVDGRRVELTAERWAHILEEPDGHPELAGLVDHVMRAVAAPERRRAGRAPNEEWLYVSGAGPSRWLKVVVLYAEGRGFVVTAHPRRGFP